MSPSLGLMLAACAAFAARGQEAPRPKAPRPLPGTEVQFKTRDGWTLAGTYLPAKPGEKTALLLHDQGGRRQDWAPLCAAMAKRGIGYLAWDLRGHGQSQSAPEGVPSQWNKFVVTKAYNEWDNMREDVAAAAAFLEGKSIFPDDYVLGGGDVGGNLALKYAAVHPKIPMVFMLAPGLAYREVLTVNAMRAYKGRPILLVVADDDRKCQAEAAVLANFARQSAGEKNLALWRVPIRHGTRMISANKGLAARLLDWIQDPSSVREAPPEAPVNLASDGLPSDEALEKAAPSGR